MAIVTVNSNEWEELATAPERFFVQLLGPNMCWIAFKATAPAGTEPATSDEAILLSPRGSTAFSTDQLGGSGLKVWARTRAAPMSAIGETTISVSTVL